MNSFYNLGGSSAKGLDAFGLGFSSSLGLSWVSLGFSCFSCLGF